MESKRLIVNQIADVDLSLPLIVGHLPPQRLALIVLGMGRGRHHERALAVGHQNRHIAFSDPVPFDHIIRRHLVDELRETALGCAFLPAAFPFPDHPPDDLGVPSRVASVRFNDRPTEDGNRRELTGFADALHHLHLDFIGGLDGDLAKVPPDRVPNGPSFFHIGNDQREAERQKTDQHHGGDDAALERMMAAKKAREHRFSYALCVMDSL